MQDIKKLYSELSNVDIGDLGKNQQIHIRDILKKTTCDDLITISDHKMYLEILQKFRILMNDNFELVGKNFLKTITSMLSVGEDGVYSNSKRFLFELIQNVDDCEYEDISDCHLDIQFRYNISPGEIILKYNEKGFAPKDVFAITGIAENSKNISADKTEIGEKGIGFKSVFGVADKVRIESGMFSFELNKNDFTVPIPVYDNFKPVKGTVLTLQMPANSVRDIYRSMKEQYKTEDAVLNNNPLIFLNKLTHLKMFFDNSFRYIEFNVERKTPEHIGDIAYENNVEVSVDIRDHDNGLDYEDKVSVSCRRYTMPIIYGAEECASRYGNNAAFSERRHNLTVLFPEKTDKIKKYKGLLYSFLPTQVKMTVPVIIHAPFKLGSSREFVDPQGKNQWFVFTVKRLSDFLKRAYVHLAGEIKQDILFYIPENGRFLFDETNEKISCLLINELSGEAICKEKIFFTADGKFENIENIVAFSVKTRFTDPLRIFSFLNIKSRLFVPNDKIDMQKFGAKVISDIPERLFKAGIKNGENLNEIAELLNTMDEEIDYEKLIKDNLPFSLSSQQLKVFVEHKRMSDALINYSNKCILNQKRLRITFENGFCRASNEITNKIRELIDGSTALKKEYSDYLSHIDFRFLLDSDESQKNSIAFAGENAVVLARDNELNSFASLTEKYDPQKLFVSSLRLSNASDDLNKAEKTMSDSEFMDYLREVRTGIYQSSKKMYRQFINLINQSGSDKRRFLNELLQNADDCIYPEGEIPSFSLRKKGSSIIVSYNEKGFKKSDVRAITAIGESTKNRIFSDENGRTIGEKGVGFKSVFNVADSVDIHSGKFHFTLDKDMPTIPQRCKSSAGSNSGTELVFSMKEDVTKSFNADEIIRRCCCLRKLKRININRISVNIKDNGSKRTISVGEKSIEFEKYTHDFKISDNQAIIERSVNGRDVSAEQTIYCYLPEKGNDKEYSVYAGLPTDITCSIPVIVDAPFELTTSRDDVLKCRWNNIVIQEIYNALLSIMMKRRGELRIHVLKYVSENTFSDEYLNKFDWKATLKRAEILPVLDEDRFVSPEKSRCVIVPDIVAYISKDYDITEIYDGEVIDTYRGQKYKSILKDIGCYESSHDDDLCCINMAVTDMINDSEFRNLLYSYLNDIGGNMNARIEELPIYPIRTEDGTKFVTYSDMIYYHDDKLSDDNFLILDTDIMSRELFNDLTKNDVQKLTDSVYEDCYRKKLIKFIVNPEKDDIEKGEYILDQFINNLDFFSACKFELKGRGESIPMEMLDGSFRQGNKFLNKNKYVFSGDAVKKLIVSERFQELAEYLDYEDITQIHYEDFDPKPPKLSDDDIQDIMRFRNKNDILKGFYEDGCISEKQLKKFNIEYLQITNQEIQQPDEDFPAREAPDLGRLKEKIKKEFKNNPNPYLPKEYTRWEPKNNPVDKGSYSKIMYGSSKHSRCSFCQMCGKPVSQTYIDYRTILLNPKYYWEQMQLNLCLKCSKDYILLRKEYSYYNEFIQNIRNADVESDDTVAISIGDKEITFTSAHLAEVQAILKIDGKEREKEYDDF